MSLASSCPASLSPRFRRSFIPYIVSLNALLFFLASLLNPTTSFVPLRLHLLTILSHPVPSASPIWFPAPSSHHHQRSFFVCLPSRPLLPFIQLTAHFCPCPWHLRFRALFSWQRNILYSLLPAHFLVSLLHFHYLVISKPRPCLQRLSILSGIERERVETTVASTTFIPNLSNPCL